MKAIKDILTESGQKMTFDIQADIYNAISDVAFAYENANKKFDRDDVEKAFDNFLTKFFE